MKTQEDRSAELTICRLLEEKKRERPKDAEVYARYMRAKAQARSADQAPAPDALPHSLDESLHAEKLREADTGAAPGRGATGGTALEAALVAVAKLHTHSARSIEHAPSPAPDFGAILEAVAGMAGARANPRRFSTILAAMAVCSSVEPESGFHADPNLIFCHSHLYLSRCISSCDKDALAASVVGAVEKYRSYIPDVLACWYFPLEMLKLLDYASARAIYDAFFREVRSGSRNTELLYHYYFSNSKALESEARAAADQISNSTDPESSLLSSTTKNILHLVRFRRRLASLERSKITRYFS